MDLKTEKYACLNQQVFINGKYSIVPLRYQDRFKIMKWRNEQIFHLRQSNKLTEKMQEKYFSNVVAKLFFHRSPGQVLFSFLKESICIGYGGLVKLNWVDKNAEISFVMNTGLEKVFFEKHWEEFLDLIYKVAFKELKLHKIFTYSFDVRPNLYPVLEKKGLKKEAILKEHCRFEAEYKDVIIHSIYNPN